MTTSDSARRATTLGPARLPQRSVHLPPCCWSGHVGLQPERRAGAAESQVADRGCLEVAMDVWLLVSDLGAVAAHQGRGTEQSLGHLVDAGIGRSLTWPGISAGQALFDGRGLS